MSKRCPECRRVNEDSRIFCTYCGATLDAELRLIQDLERQQERAREEVQAKLNRRVAAADATHPDREGGKVTCPGERTKVTRARSMKEGVVVDETIWSQICSIAGGNLDVKDIASF